VDLKGTGRMEEEEESGLCSDFFLSETLASFVIVFILFIFIL